MDYDRVLRRVCSVICSGVLWCCAMAVLPLATSCTATTGVGDDLDAEEVVPSTTCERDDVDDCSSDPCVDGGCDDDDACTEDSCDGATGECNNTILECAGGEECMDGECVEIVVVPCEGADCNDGDACTEDSCDSMTGECSNEIIECADREECVDGACVEIETDPCAGVECHDENDCTDDTCDSETGECAHAHNTAECNDGNACTDGDMCSAGTCGGLAITCDDDNVCTDDSCDPESGCANTHNEASCDDGDACTEHDACADGNCSGTLIECGEDATCLDGACVRVRCPADADCVIAGYEPSEMSDLTVRTDVAKDPTLIITWPLLGGSAGVPTATEGDHVLKMEWASEIDRKVEVRHDWTHLSFDLAGYSEIHVDVYVETDTALPGIIGIWDDVFGWIAGFPLPTSTNEWITVSLHVGHLDNQNLDHIFALLFEELSGDGGTIYVDNLRLVSQAHSRQIQFAGVNWTVKSGYNLGPGPNHFSDSEENVWVDTDGYLHLRIVEENGFWYCAEVIADDSRGYGTYTFTLKTRVDSLDDNVVLGLFTWNTGAPEHNYREIDFEFGPWGDPANDNAQFVIQPWNAPANLHRFNIDYSGTSETTTHVMTWQPDGIEFTSYYGDFTLFPPSKNIIETWHYTGSDNPPPGGENIRMNLWLVNGVPPRDSQDVEVVIAGFHYRSDVPVSLAR